ncbi:hypothetical protein BZL54_19060 [Burkholderia ubonensis subsp. mesacidophila]|uniref:3-sulfinopropanoyl-CoA desulfinase n=2 Tax=Burkholderia ubonensis TaxID=101571 RepID=A0A2A4FBJ3_9BURK|nr:hypothetical protein BZL54_19060 [Burkholderia ubonensis subsp. mesacidophila]
MITTPLVDEVSRFCDEVVRPRAGEFDAAGAIPASVIGQMAELGVLGATLPTEYGGAGLDPLAHGELTETLSRACSSLRTLSTVHLSLVAQSVLRWGNARQKRDVLPDMAAGRRIGAFALSEADAGSGTEWMSCSYRKVADRYVLNGAKKWISFAGLADLFLVFARDADGAGTTAFLLERERHEVRTTPIDHLISTRASHLAEVVLEDVVASSADIVGVEHGAGRFVAPYALDHGRFSIAWAGVGLAREALATMVDYARERRQFGEALTAFQLIQALIAEASCKAHAARALCVEASGLRARRAQNATAMTTMAKHFAATTAVSVCNDAIQVHGANGLSTRYAPERLWRDARSLEIIEGTSQIQQTLIARYVVSSPDQLFPARSPARQDAP